MASLWSATSVRPFWAASTPLLALASDSRASRDLAAAASVPSSSFPSDERTSPRVESAPAIFSAAAERVSVSASFESPRASSMAFTTTSLTVDTKVELMVSSSVEAPVSVIFGETGPAFSFT